LPCGAVIAANGDVVARAGDFAAFASAGLVSALLGPYGVAGREELTARASVLRRVGKGAQPVPVPNVAEFRRKP